MTDRLFRFLPWAPFLLPCSVLGLDLVAAWFGGRPSFSLRQVLLSLGMRETILFWLVPTIIAVLHLAADKTLPVLAKRAWRRHLLVGGATAGLIYLFTGDRHVVPGTAPQV